MPDRPQGVSPLLDSTQASAPPAELMDSDLARDLVMGPDRLPGRWSGFGAGNEQRNLVTTAGKDGMLGFFIGQLMKATGGKANPQLASNLMKALLDAM